MADAEPSQPPGGHRRRGRPPASAGPGTRERILAAAQRRFGELGYSGLSVEQLARELGLAARSIYHYFPSKRALFRAATDAVFDDYVAAVAARVLVPGDLRRRLHGFVDLYRNLYAERPHVLPFIAVVMLEGIAASRDARRGEPPDQGAFGAEDLAAIGSAALAMNRLLVDQAVESGELSRSIGSDAAAALLQTVGMGLGLASLDPDVPFLPMLDALDLLIDGTLLRP